MSSTSEPLALARQRQCLAAANAQVDKREREFRFLLFLGLTLTGIGGWTAFRTLAAAGLPMVSAAVVAGAVHIVAFVASDVATMASKRVDTAALRIAKAILGFVTIAFGFLAYLRLSQMTPTFGIGRAAAWSAFLFGVEAGAMAIGALTGLRKVKIAEAKRNADFFAGVLQQMKLAPDSAAAILHAEVDSTRKRVDDLQNRGLEQRDADMSELPQLLERMAILVDKDLLASEVSTLDTSRNGHVPTREAAEHLIGNA